MKLKITKSSIQISFKQLENTTIIYTRPLWNSKRCRQRITIIYHLPMSFKLHSTLECSCSKKLAYYMAINNYFQTDLCCIIKRTHQTGKLDRLSRKTKRRLEDSYKQEDEHYEILKKVSMPEKINNLIAKYTGYSIIVSQEKPKKKRRCSFW